MNAKEKAIGVFDSGLGGISVLRDLKRFMPHEHYLYYGDSSFAPYGEKTREEITKRCEEICAFFIHQGVKAIVIACNTATSACVKELREEYPNLPIIGMEPAVKVAVDGKENQNVLVMATRFTLKEKKFENLLSRYSEQHVIYRQPCPELVELVEHDELDQQDKVENTLREYFSHYDMDEIDSIVLGCTHFIFFKETIRKLCGDRIQIVDGNAGTIRHVKELLAEKNELCDDTKQGSIQIFNSSKDPYYKTLSQKLLESTLGL